MSRARCDVVKRDHGPVSKAARAAFTARSISSRSPSATFARTSPVAGLYVGKVLPDAASTHFPLIRILWVLETKLETLSSDGAIFRTVAIFFSWRADVN